MRGRFLVLGAVLVASLVIGIPASDAASPQPVAAGDSDRPTERMLLSCRGAMRTDGGAVPDRGDPAARIEASGVVDLAAMRVTGFGIGASPIVVLTPSTVGFGALSIDTLTTVAEPRPATAAKSGTLVEGTIDRVSGAATILVHPAANPATIIIAIALDCGFEAAPH